MFGFVDYHREYLLKIAVVAVLAAIIIPGVGAWQRHSIVKKVNSDPTWVLVYQVKGYHFETNNATGYISLAP